MPLRITLLTLLCLLFTQALHAQTADVASLLTRPEQTNFEETSRYQDVIDFVETVADASPLIHTTFFGYSFEGRSLPLAVVGNVTDATAEAVLATGKTRVFIQANIHAGEVCGKEAMQMMLRDIATGSHAEWLDSLVLLIAPIYNADGNERITLANRPRQHGPIAGMGQRPNAQGFDLNRDHMKLDSPEARSLVWLFNEYDPHVVIDLHTTNGTRHGYHLTYSPPLHPNTDPRIDRFLREEWLPEAGQYMAEAIGWASDYYGNAWDRDAGMKQWRTFDHRPRFNNNYTGLRNRFAILSEAYSYATFKDRITATYLFVEGAVAFAARNATRIQEIAMAADAVEVAGMELAVSAKRKNSGEIQILMGDVREVRNPYSGEVMLERVDNTRQETMLDYGAFETEETEVVPVMYYIPASEKAVLYKLEDHGIEMERLDREVTIEVEAFRIDSSTVAARPFQQHHERTLYGAYSTTSETFPAGTITVQTAQPLGRLVFYLLEPRSDDGLLNWNVLDESLEGASVYPIRRSMKQ